MGRPDTCQSCFHHRFLSPSLNTPSAVTPGSGVCGSRGLPSRLSAPGGCAPCGWAGGCRALAGSGLARRLGRPAAQLCVWGPGGEGSPRTLPWPPPPGPRSGRPASLPLAGPPGLGVVCLRSPASWSRTGKSVHPLSGRRDHAAHTHTWALEATSLGCESGLEAGQDDPEHRGGRGGCDRQPQGGVG